jgi:hypothetical protein
MGLPGYAADFGKEHITHAINPTGLYFLESPENEDRYLLQVYPRCQAGRADLSPQKGGIAVLPYMRRNYFYGS